MQPPGFSVTLTAGVKAKPLNVAFEAVHHLAPSNAFRLSFSGVLLNVFICSLAEMNPLPVPEHTGNFQTFVHSLISAPVSALSSPGELLPTLQGGVHTHFCAHLCSSSL